MPRLLPDMEISFSRMLPRNDRLSNFFIRVSTVTSLLRPCPLLSPNIVNLDISKNIAIKYEILMMSRGHMRSVKLHAPKINFDTSDSNSVLRETNW